MPSDSTAKRCVLRAVEEMEDDATYEDVMERVYLLQKTERGRRQVEAGEGVPHDDARAVVKRWHA